MTDEITQILRPGERVLAYGRIHPVIFLPGAALVALGLFLILPSLPVAKSQEWLKHAVQVFQLFDSGGVYFKVKGWALQQWWNRNEALLLWPGIIAAGLGMYMLLRALMTIYATHLVVTSQRIILRRGIYDITHYDITKDRIASVTVQQSYIGRQLNYGNITFEGFTLALRRLPPMRAPYHLQNLAQTW